MITLNTITLISLICIWSLLFINIILTIAGYMYYLRVENEPADEPEEYPLVSIMIPAHNESVVIERTVQSILQFNYPIDKFEVIVINDNSTDDSAEKLQALQQAYPKNQLVIINTDNKIGGKGKSNALNIGFKQCKGEYIVIYDADNTPEKNALRYLVGEITSNPNLGAVIGKFRTRNKDVNLLTRFINIETLAFQWMAQAGRWQLFKLCTIPGTNFIIRRSILEKIGGWDTHALAEDTEISFRIYRMGYRIKFYPKAVTWEQEPQTISVWFRQRTRWVKGNIYVLIKNFPLLFKPDTGIVRFDIFYYFSVYFLLLISLITSDVIMIGNIVGFIHTTLAGFSSLLWVMAITLFTVGTFITISTEKGELTFQNFFAIILMYFSYSKLWMIVTFYGFIQYFRDVIFKREQKWYKTERFG